MANNVPSNTLSLLISIPSSNVKLDYNASKVISDYDEFNEKCYEVYENQNINKMITENIENSKLFIEPIKANKSLIRNTFFIMFLYLLHNDDYNKLRSYVYKSDINTNVNTNVNTSTNSTRANIRRERRSRRGSNRLEELLKPPTPNVSRNVGRNANKDNYRDLIIKLKKDYSNEFVRWFCYIITMSHYLFNDIKSIGDDIVSKIKITENDDLQDIINNLNKLKNVSNFGDIFNYLLVVGLLLYNLRIIGEYGKITDKKMGDPVYKPFSEYIENNSLKELLLFIFKLYFNSDLISNPIKDIYTQFNKNDTLNNCFSNILNYTFFFRYILSIYNITGDTRTIKKIIYNGGAVFNLKDMAYVDEEIGRSFFNTLAKKLGKEDLLTKLRKVKSGNLFYWEIKDYYILGAEVSRNSITLSSVGIDTSDQNKITKSQYDTNVASFVARPRNNTVVVSCLVQDNKKSIGDIVIKYDKRDLLVLIGGDVLYNIIKTGDDKYCLNRLCPKLLTIGKQCIITYEDGGETLKMTTHYTVKPLELIIGFIVGLLIKTSGKMGNIMRNVSSKPIPSSKVKCVLGNFLS